MLSLSPRAFLVRVEFGGVGKKFVKVAKSCLSLSERKRRLTRKGQYMIEPGIDTLVSIRTRLNARKKIVAPYSKESFNLSRDKPG